MSAIIKKGIDSALRKEHVAVYIVARHGKCKRCFSRDTAIKHLAYAMADRAFFLTGKHTRHDDTWIEERHVWQRGELTDEYINTHCRCMRRLRGLLAKKRVIADWCKKHDALASEYQNRRDSLKEIYKGKFEELNTAKPF